MLTLDESLFLAQGAERKCYLHPDDQEKIIKIQYDNRIGRDQNRLDEVYYQHLINNRVSLEYIPEFFGRVETNYGIGLVFSNIRDYTNKPSLTFEETVLIERFSSEQEQTLMLPLKRYLQDNKIVFGDVVLSNVLCQEYEQDKFKLMIVDGLGGRRFNLKFWLQMRSDRYTKLRISKQWQKFLYRYSLVRDSVSD